MILNVVLFQEGDNAGISNPAFEDSTPPPPSYEDSQRLASSVSPDKTDNAANRESVITLSSYPEGARAFPDGTEAFPVNRESSITLSSYPESTQVAADSTRNGPQTSSAGSSSHTSGQSRSARLQFQPVEHPLHQAMKTSMT